MTNNNNIELIPEIVDTSDGQRVKELRGRTPEQIGTILAELERVQQSASDMIVPSPMFSMVDTLVGVQARVDVKVGGDTAFAGIEIPELYDVGKVAHSQIAAKMGIPAKYYGRMLEEQAELLTTNVNTWNAVMPRNHMLRTVDGRLRAVLSDGYRPLDNFDFAKQLGSVCMEVGATVTDLSLSEERFYFRALMTDWGFPVRGRDGNPSGDVLVPGIVASNSEVGLGSLNVAGWLRRTICMNGMEVNRAIHKIHLGERFTTGLVLASDTRKAKDDALWLEVRDLTRAMFDKELVTQMVERINGAAATLLAEPVKVVEHVAKLHSLSDEQTASVLAYMMAPAIPATESGTLWGLINGITARAHDEGVEEEARLQRVGGELLERGLVGVS